MYVIWYAYICLNTFIDILNFCWTADVENHYIWTILIWFVDFFCSTFMYCVIATYTHTLKVCIKLIDANISVICKSMLVLCRFLFFAVSVIALLHFTISNFCSLIVNFNTLPNVGFEQYSKCSTFALCFLLASFRPTPLEFLKCSVCHDKIKILQL